ncbi:MAG: hypothetical protein IPG74_15645 [Flavobacteriales bacterium]|nr:hypothetical protein [Flavobacteriales bacterium]MBK7554046.1 hypothetical protein [Flavobacteriales bacterium]
MTTYGVPKGRTGRRWKPQLQHRKGVRSIALARYNSDGSLDGSFSGDGMATFDLPTPCNGDEYGLDLIIRPDGRMVVTGW